MFGELFRPLDSEEGSEAGLSRAIDEILESRRRGAGIETEELVRRYPDVADELRECLPALLLLERARTTGEPPGAGSPPPRAVLGYTLLHEIGRGGMGVVYEGVQDGTRRPVAVKFLAGGPEPSPASRRRFAREVELASTLDHPGIVRVIESGESDGRLYCVMELVDGLPLHRYIADRAPDVDERLRLFAAIADAVHHAHLKAVVHRDLKPSNIMVDAEGRPRVLDFGLARATSRAGKTGAAAPSLTQAGQLVGTLPYLSPEQVAGPSGEIDIRSDVYALGVILYELLTGRMPYESGGALAEAIQNICRVVPRPPSRFRPRLGADIDAVVMKALEKSADARYQTAAQLAEDVRCCLRREPVEARRGGTFYALRRLHVRYKREVRLAALGFLGVLLACAAVLFLYLEARRDRVRLVEEHHRAVLQRGLAHLEAGHDLLAEELLRPAFAANGDRAAHWSLVGYTLRNPLVAAIPAREQWVTSAAVSDGGRYIAYGDKTGRLTVLDGRTFETVRSIEAHSGCVRALSFEPGGSRLASGGADGRIAIWRTATGRLEFAAAAHDGEVSHVRFDSTRGVILSAGTDGTVSIRESTDRDDPPMVVVATAPALGRVAAADLSADGELMALGTTGGAIEIRDARTGRLVSIPGRLPGPVEAVRFAPGSSLVAAASRRTIEAFDLSARRRLWSESVGLPEPRPTSLFDLAAEFDGSPEGDHHSFRPALDFSSDGSILAAAGWDATLRLFGPASGRRMGELRAHPTALYAIAFEPGSSRILTGCVGSLRLWDLERHPDRLRFDLPPGIERTSVAISSRAGLLAWGGSPNGAIAVVSTSGPGAVETLEGHECEVESLVFDPSGERLASADRSGRVVVWGLREKAPLVSYRAADEFLRALAFSPDGRAIASGGRSGRIEIRRAADGVLERVLEAHGGLVLCADFSPDGSCLATGGADWRMKLFRIGDERPAREWRHGEWVTAVRFAPDGLSVATGSVDLRIRIGKAGRDADRVIARTHAHWITGLAFAAGGEVLVSGGFDEALRFWDPSTGQELATLRTSCGPLHGLAATEDGRMLAIGGDSAVQLLDLEHAAELTDRRPR